MIPTDGEDLTRLHPVYLRRLQALYDYVQGNAKIIDASRTYDEQTQLHHKYLYEGGNTAADPDRPIGDRRIFVGTPYEVHGIASGSWHMCQKKMVAALYPNPAGWGYATDWNYGAMTPGTRARFNEAASWNIPGFRVWDPSPFGLCRDVGSSTRNPDGEWWHLKPDPRVPSTIYDTEDDMTPEQAQQLADLTEAVSALKAQNASILKLLKMHGGESSQKGVSVLALRTKEIHEKVDA